MDDKQQLNQNTVDIKELHYKVEAIDSKTDNIVTDMKEMASDVKTIRENHLHHIEKDIATFSKEIAGIATDITWLKWLVMGATGVVVFGVLGVFINALFG